MTSRLAMLTALVLAADHAAAAPEASAEDERAAVRDAVAAELEALAAERETAPRLGAEARLLHFLAEATAGADARAALRKRGVEVAERALALDPDEPSALLWWTAHRGSQATPLRPHEAIRIALEIEKRLLRLREIAPDYEHGGADRVLGHVYRVAPPVVSIGSISKSEDHLRQALARDPAYPGNLLAYAQLLAQRGRCAQARRGAELVLGSPLLPRFPIEAPAWRREARALLEDCG